MHTDPGTATVPVLTREDIESARVRLGGRVRRTPTLHIEAGGFGAGVGEFWLKLESMQHTGAFKARGALNSVLAEPVPSGGVCAASGGNHGQALAWAAREIGVPAAVFVPGTCPEVKRRRLLEYGAELTVIGKAYDESLTHARRFARDHDARLVHPFDQLLTIAGAGTVTAEICADTEGLDTLLVPVGGGGLLAGALAWVRGTPVRVVAVEPANCRCLGAALAAGAPVEVAVSGAAVDSLGPRRIGSIAFGAARRHAVRHVEVSDEAIRAAQRLAWDRLRIGLEGGGATALAALTSGVYVPAAGERVGVLSCGGNLDIEILMGDDT
ncbi:serine/threonine dehydratase [Sciscionella sediminilitoris]|uniref:serine/threonine dehydratase n=1 Tax=Sciscionella sediminilitoris TaxID=1445613 RepID=UPI0004DF04B9|nr:serine/threonine dehydratase [Sciscionella sp. SE31]